MRNRLVLAAFVVLCAASANANAQADGSYRLFTVAGHGPSASGRPLIRTGLPSQLSVLSYPASVDVDRQGRVLIGDSNQVLRVSRSGLMQVMAGTGRPGYTGDGGPATRARIGAVGGGLEVAASPNGGVFVADNGVARRIRRIRMDGRIETFAGGGTLAPATTVKAREARFTSVGPLAPDAAGGVFFAADGDRVFHATTDGKLELVAGGGTVGEPTEVWAYEGHATTVGFDLVTGIELMNSGGLLIADGRQGFVFSVGPDGQSRVVAGSPEPQSTNERLARERVLERPAGLAAFPGGGFAVAEELGGRVIYVRSDGRSRVIAGGGARSYRDGIPARQTNLGTPLGVALDRWGGLLVSDPSAAGVMYAAPMRTDRLLAGMRLRRVNSSAVHVQLSSTIWATGRLRLISRGTTAWSQRITVSRGAETLTAPCLDDGYLELSLRAKKQRAAVVRLLPEGCGRG